MTRHRGHAGTELFVRAPQDHTAPIPTTDVWSAAAASPEFRLLKQRKMRFVVPATVAFLGWNLAWIVLQAWWPGVASTRVVGDLTVVLLLALGQFVTTFALTLGYTRYAGRRLDPLADQVRRRLEAGPA